MASKKTSEDSARLQAAQIREAQERAERKTKLIVISVVVVAVIAIVTAVAIAITTQLHRQEQTINGDGEELFSDYASGQPIIYSHLGVGTLDESLPTVTEYFDYSCHACADVDVLIGKELTAGADSGTYNIVYSPVALVKMGYMDPATSASLIVAQNDPEHWAAFHHAVFEYFSSQYNAGDGTVVTDAEKSRDQLKVIAAEVGVPSGVAEKFPINAASDYLEASTKAWVEAPVTGREQLGTPEFVNDKSEKIVLYGIETQDLLDSGMAGLNLQD